MYQFKQLVICDQYGLKEAEVSRFHMGKLLPPGAWHVRPFGAAEECQIFLLDDMPKHWIEQIAWWAKFARRMP